jgi:Major Facilitator Superfamily
MCADGALFSVMVGAGETYFPAFALALGRGEIIAGLLSGLPLLGGAVVQLITPFGVLALGSHRRWVVACAAVQAVTFVPLVWAALAGSMSTTLLFAVALAYWASGMSTGPAWNTWAGTLVPARMATSFFARRARLAQVALLGGLLAAGGLLHESRAVGRPLAGFAAIFLIAGLARTLSTCALAAQSEPVRMPPNFRILGPRSMLSGTARAPYLHLLGFMLALQTSVYVAAPYFSPFMLGHLRLSYGGYVALLAASLIAKALAAPMLGELAQRLGSLRVLRASSLALVPLPALWLVSQRFDYLVALQILSGVAWAAYELITLLLFFETIAPAERTSVLTLFNLANAIAVFIGTAAGGWLLAHVDTATDGYYTLFAVSAVARLIVVLWARRVSLPAVRPAPVVTRTLAVRPGAGSMDRPVLPSMK